MSRPSSPFRIGRATDNELTIADLTVSRHHLTVEILGGRLVVRDLGSTNGTTIAGASIERVELDAPIVAVVGRVPVSIGILHTADDSPVVRAKVRRSQTTVPLSPGQIEPTAAELALSPRELQVLERLADGCTDKGIARELGITEKTVQSHLERIASKTGRRRRAELTRLFLGQP